MRVRLINLSLLCVFLVSSSVSAQPAGLWQKSWPRTDFSNATVNLDDILSGGPGKDGIPAIDHPRFVKVADSMIDQGTV